MPARHAVRDRSNRGPLPEHPVELGQPSCRCAMLSPALALVRAEPQLCRLLRTHRLHAPPPAGCIVGLQPSHQRPYCGPAASLSTPRTAHQTSPERLPCARLPPSPPPPFERIPTPFACCSGTWPASEAHPAKSPASRRSSRRSRTLAGGRSRCRLCASPSPGPCRPCGNDCTVANPRCCTLSSSPPDQPKPIRTALPALLTPRSAHPLPTQPPQPPPTGRALRLPTACSDDASRP